MNDTTGGWRRVTRNEPCPVCGKPDWCGIANDGTAVRCMRVESNRESNGGWIHDRSDGARSRIPAFRPLPMVTSGAELGLLADRWVAALTDSRLRQFAEGLGIRTQGLVALGLGWTGRAWSFPMRNADRQIVGIRLRAPDGRKFAVRGSREGCFLPPHHAAGLLLFPEGATDAAALIGLGFDVVGRPSCSGGVRHCVALGRGRRCVVVADDDAPGRQGADALVRNLLAVAASVQLVVPPAKDVRDWVRAGATRLDVAAWVERAPVRHLRMREVRR